MSLSLPNIMCLTDFGGNFDKYEEALYSEYLKIWRTPKLFFRGKPIAPITDPKQYKGRDFSYGHMISTGSKEDERRLDIRRCERLCWVRPILSNIDHPSLKLFRQRRSSKNRIVVWLESHNYIIVLDERNKNYTLITTYLVSRGNKAVYNKEYDQYIKDVAKNINRPI